MLARLRVPLCLILLLGVAGACSSPAAVSFDPTGACSADGSAVGAYPDLERLVPASFEGRGPDRLDSGRNCSRANLGALFDAGFREVRFAGGAWDLGGYRAAALVVFEAAGLTADRVAEFYASSAREANRTQVTAQSTPTVAGRPGHRLDSTTGDRLQTVVVWPGATSGRVNVVITNDLPDPKIEAAVAAFGDD